MKSIDELIKEHKAVKMMLEIMEGMAQRFEKEGTVDKQHLKQAVEFCRVFVDHCHHSKEEDNLFPAIQKAGKKENLMQELLGEHELGRGHVKAVADMADDIDNHAVEIEKHLTDYIALLYRHIDKEDNDLFVAAEDALSEIKDAELFAAFERIEREEVGEGRHEAFHSMLDELSDLYGK
jgi:hemerythrin-like domain-containing protein